MKNDLGLLSPDPGSFQAVLRVFSVFVVRLPPIDDVVPFREY
jgi:hypothetical protein